MRASLHSRMAAVVFIFIFFVLITVEASATIRRVPADYPTIQQAITAAVNGDTVLVASGTYVENINFIGKAITVTSEAGPQATIIDGHQSGPVVTFASGETRASIITGFWLRNGFSPFTSRYLGGGVNIYHSSPTVLNNVISNNGACSGSGVGVEIGSPAIVGNRIMNNTLGACTSVNGGGIYAGFSANVEVVNNIIADNHYGGGIVLYNTQPAIIRGNLIQGNWNDEWGGGISLLNGSAASVTQNLIVGNLTPYKGGGIYWQTGGGELVNNTIADNLVGNFAGEGSAIYGQYYDAQTRWHNNLIVGYAGKIALSCALDNHESLILRNNDVYSLGAIAYSGACSDQTGINGNLSADPLFVHPAAGDAHLLPNSPVIDKGDNSAPNLPATDLDGKPRIQDGNGDGVAIVDMGAYEAPATGYSLCIQDDSNGNILQINTTTGAYQLTNCAGLTIGGTGIITKRGSGITLQHNASDRRVMATIDTATNRATASIQFFAQGRTFSLTDRDIRNNTCACR